jgi:hypothetical protein
MSFHEIKSLGLDIKDCPLAQGNQVWLSGKQIPLHTCPTDHPIFCFFVDNQKVHVEPWRHTIGI